MIGGDCTTAARPRLRADAVRNRERILAAARDAFVDQGKDAPSTKSLDRPESAMPPCTGTSPTGKRSSTTWCST